MKVKSDIDEPKKSTRYKNEKKCEISAFVFALCKRP